mgnify:CR=1 FL=1
MKFTKTLCLVLLFPTLLVAQTSIKATFSPADDYKWAILYKNTPLKNIYVAQGKIENGTVEFLLDSTKTKGVYKVVYAAPQDEYNFDLIYNGNENIELEFNAKNGITFKQSSGNLMLNSYLVELATIGKEIEAFYINKKTDSLELETLFKRQLEMQNNFEEKSKNTLAQHFVKANKPYIPSNYEDARTYINNLTVNYFSSVDFNNPVLQSSNFLQERSLAYIFGVSNNGMDKASSYNYNIDVVSQLVSTTDSVFQKSFLEKLWNKLVSYNLKDTANYLATTHLIPLAEEQKDTVLVLKLSQFKNLSIGSVAPEILWETEKNGLKEQYKLSELAIAENYILVFWSSGCSHCLEEIPKLKTLVQSLDKTKYKVIAIGLEDEAIKWEKEAAKYPEFINIIKLKKWENEIIQTYGLTSTPTYFLLDKDKRFIAKPESLEDLEKLFDKIK